MGPPGDDKAGPLEAGPTGPLLADYSYARGPTVPVGEVLASRFRILRFIASGGMGEVYEAEDLELNTHVALKTIRLSAAGEADAMERFRGEVRLAHEVTHTNVCRIFDLFRHIPAGEEPGGPVTFLTMELLSGETLADRLRRRGPMVPEEALEIVEQLAAGLTAAHRAGVVHGDLKSANVVLAPSSSGERRPRAVITDFGLARGRESIGRAGEAGSPAGTPAYMAPEQVEGKEATRASDLYALGVVLFEMVTGAFPFVGDTAAATARKRLEQPPPSPRGLARDLPPPWDAAILRCLERDPARRFASASDVVEALRGDGAGRARRTRFALAAVALVAAVAAAALLRGRGPSEAGAWRASVQVTSSTGLDAFADFSPDGKAIAYSSDRSGSFEVYVRGLAPGSREVQITRDGRQNLQPAWSPDGQRLAYHSQGRRGVWVVAAEGGEPQRLTGFGSRPAWSPDGRVLAFQSEGVRDLSASATSALAPSTIWRVPAGGGEPRQLTRPGDPPGGHGTPSWSPSGRRILFGSFERRSSSIWSVEAVGGAPTRVAALELRIFDPVWAPDGGQVVYVALIETGSYGLFSVRVSPETGAPLAAPVQIAALGPGTARHPALSADGRRIAYTALSMPSNLYALPLTPEGDAPAGRPRPLTAETGRNVRPAFSRDGSRLVFERWTPGSNADVWMMNVEGGEARQLTTSPAVDDMPGFFPGGERVLFLSHRTGGAALWSVDLPGGAQKQVLALDQDIDFPRLSPDGGQVAFNSRRNGRINVWVAPLGNGLPRRLSDDPERLGFACWSPDGLLLAAQRSRGDDTHVVVLPVEGGEPVQLTDEPGQSWAYSFAPDGDRIAFAGLRGDLWNLYWVSRRSREQRQLTRQEKLSAYVRSPAWSPKGDLIVYEYGETTGNIWIMERAR